MGESGSTWKLVKSNGLDPTKSSLYKGMGTNRERLVFLGLREGEEERRQHREREREGEKEKGEIQWG